MKKPFSPKVVQVAVPFSLLGAEKSPVFPQGGGAAMTLLGVSIVETQGEGLKLIFELADSAFEFEPAQA